MLRQIRRVVFVLALTCLVGLMRPDFSTTPAFAADEGGVTCACCGWVDLGNGPFHLFFTGNDLCGYPMPGPMELSTVECSRCGGTSSCHTVPQPGACHLACGGENLRKIEDELATAIDSGNADAILLLIQSSHKGAAIAFSKNGGRLEVTADCDPAVVAASFAITPELNAALAARWSE